MFPLQVRIGMARTATFLLVLLFALWQGGFAFYAAAVIPTGASQLNSDLIQGFITQTVTSYLNWIGIATIVYWGIYLWSVYPRFLMADDIAQRWSRRICWAAWMGLIIGQCVLIGFHWRLDAVLDPRGQQILNDSQFHGLHQAYEIAATIEWALALVLLWFSLPAHPLRKDHATH